MWSCRNFLVGLKWSSGGYSSACDVGVSAFGADAFVLIADALEVVPLEVIDARAVGHLPVPTTGAALAGCVKFDRFASTAGDCDFARDEFDSSAEVVRIRLGERVSRVVATTHCACQHCEGGHFAHIAVTATFAHLKTSSVGWELIKQYTKNSVLSMSVETAGIGHE